jgi:uncharacterized protein involved in response to NO
MNLLHIDEPLVRPAPDTSWRHPLWRLGFRPFYLACALFAALAIPLWIASLFGWTGAALPALRVGLLWHMHEMVFGMASAVIVGFLYTAGRNWTGLPTPVRGRLAALVALWVAGRAAMLFVPAVSGATGFAATGAALVDWLFLPLAAWPLAAVLRKAGNRRNYFLVGLLALMALANGAFHAGVAGWLALDPVHAIESAILVVALMEAAIGTRIIPMFTRNGVPGCQPAVSAPLDRASLALLALAGVAWAARAPAWLVTPLALLAGVLVLLRVLRWQPHKTLRHPLVWILHLSYAWIGAGMLLLAAAGAGWGGASAAFHALAVGGMAGLVVGMMTRTTLGHTGRMLRAGRAETTMFVLIQLGALARVAAALWTGPAAVLLVASAACWSVAFALYAMVYLPYLASARIDGKEG